MEKISRISKIEMLANKTKEQKEMELERVVHRNHELRNVSPDIAKRVNELIDVANSCLKNGIDIGQKETTRYNSIFHGKQTNDFMTDGVNHTIGFYRQNGIIGIGKKGTGCCCYNYVYIGTDGIAYSDAHSQTFRREVIDAIKNENALIEELLKGLDGFEKRFYDFIDSL